MVYPHKAKSALSIISEDYSNSMNNSMKSVSARSYESIYSSATKSSVSIINRTSGPPSEYAQLLKKRCAKRERPAIPASNAVRQCVLSARRLRFQTYHNRITEYQNTIQELMFENRRMQSLQKRQEIALAKYESANAELPQLLHSHAEEMRVWQIKYRNLQSLNRELETRLKCKEEATNALIDQNKYLNQLSRDKNLEERHQLTQKVAALETKLQEKDNDLKLLARRQQLELKSLKQQLQNEQKKNKEVVSRLDRSRMEAFDYRQLDELSLGEKADIMQHLQGRSGIPNNKTKNEIAEMATELSKQAIAHEPNLPSNNMRLLSGRSNKSNSSIAFFVPHNNNHDDDDDDEDDAGSLATKNTQKSFAATLEEAVLKNKEKTQQEKPKISALTKKKESLKENMKNKKKDIQQNSEILNPVETDDNVYGSERDSVGSGVASPYDDEESETSSASIARRTVRKSQAMSLNGLENSAEEEEEEQQQQIEAQNYSADSDENDMLGQQQKTCTDEKKPDINITRKQLNNEYKQREMFLDSYCRGVKQQQEIKPKIRPIKRAERTNTASARKRELLAALRDIDGNHSDD